MSKKLNRRAFLRGAIAIAPVGAALIVVGAKSESVEAKSGVSGPTSEQNKVKRLWAEEKHFGVSGKPFKFTDWQDYRSPKEYKMLFESDWYLTKSISVDHTHKRIYVNSPMTGEQLVQRLGDYWNSQIPPRGACTVYPMWHEGHCTYRMLHDWRIENVEFLTNFALTDDGFGQKWINVAIKGNGATTFHWATDQRNMFRPMLFDLNRGRTYDINQPVLIGSAERLYLRSKATGVVDAGALKGFDSLASFNGILDFTFLNGKFT